MKQLLDRSVKPGTLRTAWASAEAVAKIDLRSLKEQTIDLSAPITKVQEFLQKRLKPNRTQVSAVRFTNGHVEQLTEATLQIVDAPAEQPKKEEEPKPKPKPTAAVTVAQPVLGCPAPDFDDVEIRATRVLKAFLTPEQIEDFEKRQQFVAVGADTGHRYLITSRNSKHALSQHQSFRSLYDLDERTPFCVHDWEVPAAEELLGLFVHVSLPGLERYVRNVPDREGILH